jgi:hypothetical protein
MGLRSYRGSVDVKVHLSMAPIVPTVYVNTAFVRPTPRHHLVIVITGVDAQHKARGLDFCVIYAIQKIQLTEHVGANANLNFLVQNAKGFVTPIYHTITATKCATRCDHREANAMHATVTEHVKMDFVSVIQTGSTMVEKNVYRPARVHRYVVVMEHANCMGIRPGAYVNEVGMVKTVIYHVRGC